MLSPTAPQRVLAQPHGNSTYTVQGLISSLSQVCVPSPISHTAWVRAHKAPALVLAKLPIRCDPDVERGAPCRTSRTAQWSSKA